jgi:hypothetical protein
MKCLLCSSKKVRAKGLCPKHYFQRYDRSRDKKARAKRQKEYLKDPIKLRDQHKRLKRWYNKNAAKVRDRKLKSTYGVDTVWFEAKLKEQNYCCALCHRPFGDETPRIDHSHVTGVLRGLLHGNCNTGIGLLKDNPTICRLAAEYLEKYDVMDV